MMFSQYSPQDICMSTVNSFQHLTQHHSTSSGWGMDKSEKESDHKSVKTSKRSSTPIQIVLTQILQCSIDQTHIRTENVTYQPIFYTDDKTNVHTNERSRS